MSSRDSGNMEYDYIVVGGGSSGCVIATHLSRDPTVRVLLLESGPLDIAREVVTPALFPKAISKHDWSHHSEPCKGCHNRRVWLPTAKCLGGSSSIFPPLYLRGHRSDYDNWAAVPGCKDWSYEAVLPYYKRAENNRGGRSAAHGTGGAIEVADLKHVHPVTRVYAAAAVEQGLPRQFDLCSAQEGTGFFQVASDSGARLSTAGAYVRPASKRENLGLRVGVHVSRILFDGTRAVGVAYVRNNEKFEARAAREVILCCGAIGTPKLLQVSGVGPRAVLDAAGVKPVAYNEGVGASLRSPVGVPVGFNCGSEDTLDAEDNFVNRAKFATIRVGPLTSPVFEAGSFYRSSKSESHPDLAILFCPGWFTDHGRGARPTGHGFTMLTCLTRPESTGRVSVVSADPYDKPAVDCGFLAEERDVSRMVTAVKTARHVAEGFAFAAMRGEEIVPGPDVEGDAAVAEHIREHLQPLYHSYGSCPMGARPAAEGGCEPAVAPDLTVYGTEGLRIADASVIPCVLSAPSSIPAVMIAERAADLIIAGTFTMAPECPDAIPGIGVDITQKTPSRDAQEGGETRGTDTAGAAGAAPASAAPGPVDPSAGAGESAPASASEVSGASGASGASEISVGNAGLAGASDSAVIATDSAALESEPATLPVDE